MKITYDTIPTALEYLIHKVESLESRLAMSQVQQPIEPIQKVLNRQQALDFLNQRGVFIKASSLYKKTATSGTNNLPHRKIAGRLVFDRNELENWVETQATKKQIINLSAVSLSARKKLKS